MTVPSYQDIGASTGPLRHIWIGADGSFQVEHVATGDYLLYPSDVIPADGGTFLDYGYLYSPHFDDHTSTGVPALGAQLWDMHSQSVVSTINGVSRVITQLQTLGDDITITQIDTYVHGQDCWRTDMIVQNDYTSAVNLRLYRALNAYLNGSDDGYGVTKAGGVVGVAENSGNDPSGPAIWLIPLIADEYFEGDPDDLWDLLIGPSALPNTVVTASGDAAMGLAWYLTVPAKSLVVRSCLTQVVIPSPVVPPALDAWHFRGFCYRGADGDTQTPLGGVTLKLYVGSTSTFANATLKRTTISDAGGFWNFYEDQEYSYYWVEAVVPSGMSATGSDSDDGTIISDTLIRWGASPARGVHGGNRFFMQ